jgi:hypothetical protein
MANQRGDQVVRKVLVKQNWAVGREYLDRTPFRRGTEVLIRLELEDNKRRRRVSEEEEAALLAVTSPHLRSIIIAALDTGMRQGEMLALKFGDIDWKQRVIVLRGATTKSRRTRVVPIGMSRLLAVLEWLRLDSTGERKATRSRSKVAEGQLQGPQSGLPAAVLGDQPALALPEARVRLTAGRAGRSACPGPRPARSRVDSDDRALRQPAA